jgi:heme exporter protein C
MAIASAIGFIWRHELANLYSKAVAPLGAGFTAICLITGSLWGQPMWGTWWVWDARLTSVLILFFLYLGYIALINAFDDVQRGLKAGAILLLVGFVNIPIIKFSVEWWNTLHQPASLSPFAASAIDSVFLEPLLIMAGAYLSLFIALALIRLRTEIMSRKILQLQYQS